MTRSRPFQQHKNLQILHILTIWRTPGNIIISLWRTQLIGSSSLGSPITNSSSHCHAIIPRVPSTPHRTTSPHHLPPTQSFVSMPTFQPSLLLFSSLSTRPRLHRLRQTKFHNETGTPAEMSRSRFQLDDMSCSFCLYASVLTAFIPNTVLSHRSIVRRPFLSSFMYVCMYICMYVGFLTWQIITRLECRCRG